MSRLMSFRRMAALTSLRRAAALAALLPLGGCYVAPGALSPLGVAEGPGTVYAPPPRGGEYIGATCSAGNYTCPVAPGPLGAQCSCPGLGAPSFGVIR